MDNNEITEKLFYKLYHSPVVRKIYIILVFVGIVICIIPLLSPVQNIIFSFVDSSTSGTNLRTSGTFESRLYSLLSLPFFGLLILLFALFCFFSKNIYSFLINKKKTTYTLAAGIIVFLLVFTTFFTYNYGHQWLNSDHSSEIILGELLAEENVFVSTSWRYSTEIRLIYQTIFFMPLFKIFGSMNNWALIRSLTILFNNLVLFLSFYFLAKQLKIQTKWILITGSFLFIPISLFYWDIVTFGGYYIFIIIQFFFCFGLFINLNTNSISEPKTKVYFILYTFVSFALGIQGIRSLYCFIIPLLITCVFIYLKTKQKNIYSLFLGLYAFVLSCIGFAASYLLQFKYSFYSFDNEQLENLFENLFNKLTQSIVVLFEFFGFSSGTRLMSAHGILGVLALIGTFLLFFVIIKYIIKNINNQKEIISEYNFLFIFYIVAVIFNIFILVIINKIIIDRYYIPFLIFFVPIIAILFEYSEKNHSHFKHIAIFSAVVLFVFGQGYLNFQKLAQQDFNTSRRGYIQYLQENQLLYGFATHWNASVSTELSNGKIKIAGLEPDGLEPESNQFRLQGWLNPKQYYEPSYYDGESFLLLTGEEWELARETKRPFSFLQPDYNDGEFIILRFPSAQIIHNEVLDK